MTVLAFAGAESGHIDSEVFSHPGSVAVDSAVKRTGGYSFKCTDSGYLSIPDSGASSTVDYFAQGFFYFSNLPSATVPIIRFGAGTYISAKVTAAGKLQLWNDASTTQIGSDSSATISADGTTVYKVELRLRIGIGATDQAEVRLNGTSVASGTNLTISDTPVSSVRIGWVENAGASRVLYFDDFVLNDGLGSANNTWMGDAKVIISKPISDNTITNWTAGAGGGSSLFAAIDNVPPAGLTSASETNTSNIESASSTGTATYIANMQSYTAAGVPSGGTVRAVQETIVHGEDAGTGTKTGTFEMTSNPVISSASLSEGGTNQFGVTGGGAHAGFPSLFWASQKGALVDSPSVTLGNQPACKFVKTDTTTRTGCICFVGLMILYTDPPATNIAAVPAVATASAPAPAIQATKSATITAVRAQAQAAAPSPVIQVPTNKSITAVLAAASATIPAPTFRSDKSIAGLKADASASAVIPVIQAQKQPSIAAVRAQANSAAPIPVITAIKNPSIAAVRAQAQAAAVVPSLLISRSVPVLPAPASASAPNPAITTTKTASPAALPATALANAPAPVRQVDKSIAGLPAQASAAVVAPTVSIGATGATVNALPAQAQSAAPLPAVTTTKTVSVAGVRAQAQSAAPIPVIAATKIVAIAALVAQAQATVRLASISIVQDRSIAGVRAQAQSAAPIPAITATKNPTITAVKAAAQAQAIPPTISTVLTSTGLSMSGPNGGASGAQSGFFTVALAPPGSQYSLAVTVTPNDGGAGGTFSPPSFVLPANTVNASGTFRYTPAADGTVTISITNDRGLANPPGIVYTSPLEGGIDPQLILHMMGPNP